MLSIYRTLFFIIIIFVVIFLGTHHNKINISTDLKDLSPILSNELIIQKAINTLSKDIESRFMLIITSDNAEQVEQAAKQLKIELAGIDNISIDGISTELFLKKLGDYRFQLLTANQRKQLQTDSITTLAEQAQRNLYRIDSSLQLLPINKDPLGTFDHFISNLIDNNLGRTNSIQALTEGEKSTYYLPIPIIISQGAMQIDKQHALIADINKVDRTLSERFPVHILRSGVFFFAADAAEKSETDIKLISTISTTGIVLLLLFVFRSLSILLLPILSIAIGIVFAVGVSHYLYNSIHILTIVFGASLIGIIIDYSLHYFYHQKSHSAQEQNKENTQKLYRAMLLSLLTSLVGYSALSFSSLDALRKVALFSCCGIFAAWLSVITIGSLSKIKNINASDSLFSSLLNIINGCLGFITSKLSLTGWGCIVILGSILLYGLGLPANDNPHLFFNPAENLLKQEQEANKFSNSFEPGRYIVITGDTTEAVYDNFTALFKVLESELKTNINTVLFSAMQLLPSPKQQEENYQLQSKIYQPEGVANLFFSTLGIPPQQASMLYDEYAKSINKKIEPSILFNEKNINEKTGLPPIWTTENGKNVAFAMIKKGADTERLETIVARHKNKLNGIVFINTLALSEKSLKEQRLSASILLMLAYLFIALMMLVYYRSFNALWVLLVPLTATLGTLAIFVLFSINITLFNVMGLFLVLGLGMDYVIFIKEMNSDKATTQNAILLSTLTTLLSFGLLSLSNIPVAQAFGTTLLIGNTLNFLGSLVYAQLNKPTIVAQ